MKVSKANLLGLLGSIVGSSVVMATHDYDPTARKSGVEFKSTTIQTGNPLPGLHLPTQRHPRVDPLAGVSSVEDVVETAAAAVAGSVLQPNHRRLESLKDELDKMDVVANGEKFKPAVDKFELERKHQEKIQDGLAAAGVVPARTFADKHPVVYGSLLVATGVVISSSVISLVGYIASKVMKRSNVEYDGQPL